MCKTDASEKITNCLLKSAIFKPKLPKFPQTSAKICKFIEKKTVYYVNTEVALSAGLTN